MLIWGILTIEEFKQLCFLIVLIHVFYDVVKRIIKAAWSVHTHHKKDL